MTNTIATQNENSLHAQIKLWYAQPGDLVESRVGDYIVDVVRNDLLIEIQTANFAAIKKKINNLLVNHCVRLIYPIVEKKWLVHVDQQGCQIRRRKSPARGRVTDLFHELIRMPELVARTNFSLEVLMIIGEEIRRNDGKGSWRRKGISIIDQRLIKVQNSQVFESPQDFVKILPPDLPQPFTNHDLSQHWDITIYRARKATYCLKKMGAIQQIGKTGREMLFAKI